MANILTNFKDSVVFLKEEHDNEKLLKQKNVILTDMRICTAAKESVYIKAHINSDEKKMYFLSKRIVESGSILSDAFGNIYKINNPFHGNNELLDNKVTTICSFDYFVPQNEFRKSYYQVANITQTISNMSFQNIENLTLDLSQIAKIEQSITVEQLVDSAEEEMKYRYKPISGKEAFIAIINEIISSKRSINDLKEKAVQAVLKQASGLLQTLLNLLIKKIKSKIESEQK